MIQNIIRKSLALTVTKFDWSALLRQISQEGQVGVIFGIKNEILERFGIKPERIHSSVLYPTKGSFFGDIFFPDAHTTLYLKVSGHRTSEETMMTEENVWADPGQSGPGHQLKLIVEAGEIAPIEAGDGQALGALMQAVNKHLQAQGIKEKSLEWSDLGGGPNATPPFHGSAAVPPDQRSLELAAIFRDGKLGSFLEHFGGDAPSFVLDEYLESVPNREETEYYIDKLFEADFITEEVAVYCRKTGAPTIRAKDRAALDALAGAGISCSCGEPLQNEKIRRLIILPEKNRPFASSTWLARTFLINMLMKLGYRSANIFVSEIEGGLDLAYVPSDGKGLLFALAPGEFSEQSAKELWATIGKKTDNLKLVIYGAKGIDALALEKLETRVGADNVMTLAGLDEFNTKLLEGLSKERLASILATFTDFQNQLNIDIAALALKRFGE